MKFTIEKVGKLTGLSAVTLRNWEKRYGFPSPLRAESGHRFYSCADIEFLKSVKQLLESGHNLSQISESYKEWRANHKPSKSSALELVDDVEYRVQLLYKSLIGFNNAEALGHYNILNAKLSPAQFFDRVVETILCRLGRDWASRQISIAQEHFASSFLRIRILSFLCLDLPLAQPIKIMAATLNRERHEGGVLIVTAHLKFRGYNVSYFGPDLPSEELRQLVREVKPDCLLLSYFEGKSFTEDLRLMEDLEIPICVGGPAFMDPVFMQKIQKKIPANIFVSDKRTGSAAASFVEMICQSQ